NAPLDQRTGSSKMETREGSLGAARSPSSREVVQSAGRPLGPHLVERARLGVLVRAPAQELGAVAEAAAGEVVVAHLADEGRLQRLPLRRPALAPPAGAARRFAGEARRRDERREDRLELPS